jgi:hypothetical protein
MFEKVLQALRPVAEARKTGLAAAATMHGALSALYDSPAGAVALLVPGDERVAEGYDDLLVLEEEIHLVVGHRPVPTAEPGEGMYAAVGGAAPFLETLEALRDAVLGCAMPEGETGVQWEYRGRRGIAAAGMPLPAFDMVFALVLAPRPPRLDGVSIATPFPGEEEPP